jgi:acyl-CoA thioesterase-1
LDVAQFQFPLYRPGDRDFGERRRAIGNERGDDPWPKLLQQMLRARGYDAQVINAGISGNDVGQELSRLDSAVGRGTRLVILDTAFSNSANRGVNIAATVDEISARLRARGIKLIVIPNMHAWADYQVRPDGTHITEQGHAAVAAHSLPLVIAALAQAGD